MRSKIYYMKKQVIFIHGGEAWNSRDEFVAYIRDEMEVSDPRMEHSKRWKHTLADELGEDYEILFLSMPIKDDARYEEWKIWFERHFKFFAEEVILIGHSLGANFLAKYLSENTFPKKVTQLHLVSGCFGYVAGFDLGKSIVGVEEQAEEIYIYHSKDDDVVSYKDAEEYQRALPTAKLETFTDRGHFLGETFPEIIQNIKN